jgi:alpha-L-rhamnosidase
MPGWDQPGFDDSLWKRAAICHGPGGEPRPMEMEPCRVLKKIEPVSFWAVRPDAWVFDMGINMTGWVSVRVSGTSGTAISLRFAEKLTSDGDIDPGNINIFADPEKFQKDIYILKGTSEEVWEPHFTYHGFQYVQVTGFPGIPQLKSITGCVVHTDLSTRGSFSCANELLNKIQAAARLSTLGNYHGIPTDCPHREKNGWTGDAALSAEQILLNFSPDKGYWKWLQDMVDCQRPNGQLPGIVPTGGWGYNWGSGPAWDSVLILLPWYLYLYRGDKEILSRYYESMKKYIDFVGTMATDNIVGFSLGDWCPPEGGPDAFKSPLIVTDTAIYAMLCQKVSDIAKILGFLDDAGKYRRLHKNIVTSFNLAFVDTATGEVAGDCQTSYACALYADLVVGPIREQVIDKLVQLVEQNDRHIDCGIIGTKYIMQVLADVGRTDLAYAIATQTTFPGWGHWIMQGATTLWETWNGNASRNHHMYSDISAWFYKCLAGINPDPAEPGFKHVIVKPSPMPDLSWVQCSHESPFGTIICNWRSEQGGGFHLELTIPASCHATVYLPGSINRFITENGRGICDRQDIRIIGQTGERTILAVEAGAYKLAATNDSNQIQSGP